MGKYEQAPLLLARGEKQRNKKEIFAQRPHELESAICCCLGNRDIVALKVMLYFTGNSNSGEFRVSQKGIYNRMNISEKPYYRARKKLESMKWIEYKEDENVIYINYNKIYSDYENYLNNDCADCRNDSPQITQAEEMTVVKELSELSLNNYEDCRNDSQSDGCKDRHNNKINNKSNNISNKKDGGIGAACAAPPPELKSIIDKFKEGALEGYLARQLIDNWYEVEVRKLSKDMDNEEYEERKKELFMMGKLGFEIIYGRRENFE